MTELEAIVVRFRLAADAYIVGMRGVQRVFLRLHYTLSPIARRRVYPLTGARWQAHPQEVEC